MKLVSKARAGLVERGLCPAGGRSRGQGRRGAGGATSDLPPGGRVAGSAAPRPFVPPEPLIGSVLLGRRLVISGIKADFSKSPGAERLHQIAGSLESERHSSGLSPSSAFSAEHRLSSVPAPRVQEAARRPAPRTAKGALGRGETRGRDENRPARGERRFCFCSSVLGRET